MIDTAFVTPHAVRQFIARISPLDYDSAREAILRGLRSHATSVRPSHSGTAVLVRVRGGEHSFRAVVSRRDGSLPAVLTVLRSGT